MLSLNDSHANIILWISFLTWVVYNNLQHSKECRIHASFIRMTRKIEPCMCTYTCTHVCGVSVACFIVYTQHGLTTWGYIPEDQGWTSCIRLSCICEHCPSYPLQLSYQRSGTVHPKGYSKWWLRRRKTTSDFIVCNIKDCNIKKEIGTTYSL